MPSWKAKKAGETFARKSTPRTSKANHQQDPLSVRQVMRHQRSDATGLRGRGGDGEGRGRCRAYGAAPTMICARSQPRLTTSSTSSTQTSRLCLQALHGMILRRHSRGDAAPEHSRPTSQRGAPPSAADARGRRLPSPGAAPRGRAGERGRPESPGPQRGRRAKPCLARRRVERRTRPH
jgi:hypothetical protein